MIFNERDINFLKLTDKQFEELCFELLLKMGYRSLIWRLGGPDSGRDIEGKLTVNNPLIGTYDEKWFFECKRYVKGVPPKELDSKIAWANAEKPQHFVILTSSYLSNNARTWLEKTAVGATYHIHVIEGKELSELLLKFPAIMKKYFINEHSKLFLETRKNWVVSLFS